MQEFKYFRDIIENLKRVNASLDRMLRDDFKNMTLSEIAQYMADYPNDEWVIEYIEKYGSYEFKKALMIEAEKLGIDYRLKAHM